MMHSRRAKGFTLIEILVVVTVIAIVTSAAMLSLTLVGDDRDARTDARRLASLLEVAMDEAIMQGREFGLELMQGGYRFVEYDPNALQWAEVPFDDTFRPRNLSEGVSMDLYIEDQRVVLEQQAAVIETAGDDEDDDRESDYAPHVFVFSSGDITPFQVRLSRLPNDEPIVLSVDALGQAEIMTESELEF
ncbi:MAG: type II secretion system minor pseudopilin GspH [Woeseiaceae bacterium]|nr:type II secretion system minor pseudopilin GspH [Woeseiaceae bacterium]